MSLAILRRAVAANRPRRSWASSLRVPTLVGSSSLFISHSVVHAPKSPKTLLCDFGPFDRQVMERLEFSDEDRARHQIVGGAFFLVKKDGQKSYPDKS